MSDVLLFQDTDGGEVRWTNGQAALEGGLSGAAYLSLFGGNEQDAGTTATERKQWWGNAGELDESRQYRSRLQHLLRSAPLSSGNLARFEEAAATDLEWMTGAVGLADVIQVDATIPGHNKVNIRIQIDGTSFAFEFRKADPQ